MKFKVLLTVLLAVLVHNTQAKVIEAIEDYTISNAPQEIVDITERVANKVGFTDGYEVVIPTKAAIQLNPWNKFVVYTINPTTKNPLILINPAWFLDIPSEEQDFLLGRYFLMFQQGPMPLSAKMVSYVFIFISLLLIGAFFWLLGKTRLSVQPAWLRVVIALLLVIVAEKLFLDRLDAKIRRYFIDNHGYAINEMAVQKLGDRDAALKALEHFDTAIKDELKNGALAFALHEKTFEKYIQELKK